MGVRILACAALVVAAAGVFFAQTPGRIEVHVVQVPLLVTVSDGKGQLVTGLQKDNFRIFENQKAQKVDTFSRELDRPLSIALLVDTSASVYSYLDFERAAAMGFFSKILKPRKDRATVIGFNSDPRLMTDFTDELDQLSAGLKKLDADGGTAVYDAIYKTAEKKLSVEAGDRRRLIILISDGHDTASAYSLAEATEMAQRHDIVIYAISVNKITATKGDEKNEGDKAIRHLVTETGGKAYYPTRFTDLGLEFEKIEAELRAQYLLSYTPSGPFNGAYRKVRVELTDRKYTAHTRAGYYATK
jgi:Ca-activated chloride channel family protein